MRIKEIMDEIWEWFLKENPVYATFIGDERYCDKLPDISKENKERLRKTLEDFRKKLSEVEITSEAERMDKELVEWFVGDHIEELEQDLEDFGIDHMHGYHLLPFDLTNFQKTDTPDRMERFLERLSKFPQLMDQHIENLKIGESKKRVQFYIQVKRCIEQIENILRKSFVETPFQIIMDNYQGEGKENYRRQLESIYDKSIRSSLGRFVDYLKVYKPRETAGIWSIPDGERNYIYLIKHHTTLELKPEEIHSLGLEELKKIYDELRSVGRKLGIEATEPREIIEKIGSDRRNFFSSRDEMVKTYEEITRKIYEKLPEFFGILPKAGVVVKAVEDYREKDSVGAFYYRPSQDGSRPGIFYINTYKPEERPRYDVVALAVHEAVPGHHLQIAIAQERTDLHPFRRHIDWDAFSEGWGLYAERLGEDMGLYVDHLQKFGMLVMQAWRAVRLVVDTGIHHFRWTREAAMDFFLKNTGLQDIEVVNEIDRYITWPAQALSYYIGMKKIMELREKATRKMSLKEFHDLILSQGGVPLKIIEKYVEKHL